MQESSGRLPNTYMEAGTLRLPYADCREEALIQPNRLRHRLFVRVHSNRGATFLATALLLLFCLQWIPAQAQTRPNVVWMHGWSGGGASAISPDGTLIATGGVAFGTDPTIKLRRTSDGSLLTTFLCSGSAPRGLAFSPDSHTLVSVGIDGIKLWDTQNRVFLRTLDTGSEVAVAFSPDGQSLATVAVGGIQRNHLEDQ